MSRKSVLSLLIVLTLLAVAVSPAFAAKEYRAEQFDVQFDLQPDGSALVTETVVFRFDGGPFTYAFRDINATETDGLTFIDASMDGESLPPGTQAGQVEVTGGDPLEVKWHFAPTSDSTHEFVVRYRVAGVVRKLTDDVIRWRAIPEEHEYPIERSTVTITYPASANPIEPPTLDRAYESSALPNGYRLTTTNIADDESVIVTARFAAGTAAETTSQWQLQQQQAEAVGAVAQPIGWLAAVVTLVLGSVGLFLYARAQRRESIDSSPMTFNTPPDDLPPALVGKLTGRAEGFMGTLFDLAQRGVVEIHEGRGHWGTKKFTLELKNAAAPLSAAEQGLLAAIFKPGETTVDMSQILTRLASKHKLFDEPLEQEMVQRGWLDLDRQRQRRNLGIAGFLLLVASLGFSFVGIIGVNAQMLEVAPAALWTAVIGIAASSCVLSIGLMIYAATFSTLTPEGEAEAARWKSFAKYLKQVSKDKSSAAPAADFERYLAWAAAFGLGSAWAKHYQRAGSAPWPVWFHAVPGSDGDFGAIVAVMAASDSAGAGAAGGGAGGASGGGASGAG
jgi:hypothetical protein